MDCGRLQDDHFLPTAIRNVSQGDDNLNYYKIINDNTICGACSSLDFRRYQTKHGIVLACDETAGQYLEHQGILYHDVWMLPVTTNNRDYVNAEIVVISENEYDVLIAAEEAGEEMPVETQPEEIIEELPVTDPIEETTVEFIARKMVEAMSKACNKAIEDGFNVTLSDGESHHFAMTTQDQLNLVSLTSMLANGEASIPYHADGELCKFFSAADIALIISKATEHKTHHITYFNSLKNYINSLENIEDISQIVYGVDIPIEYQSEVLRAENAIQNETN